MPEMQDIPARMSNLLGKDFDDEFHLKCKVAKYEQMYMEGFESNG